MAYIEIDDRSGFCMGVVKAIDKAEDFLSTGMPLYSLGDVVHNSCEIDRLEQKGMRTITHQDLEKLSHVDVLFRAHGEPPSTYELAKQQHIRLIDATCPVVSGLQKRIKKDYESKLGSDAQLVIFGKAGHAEVIGLNGQTGNSAIVIEHVHEADRLDFSKPIVLYSQTTKSLDEFRELVAYISERMLPGIAFTHHDTICRQVANRLPHLREFSARFDRVLFVSGARSSNGKALFEACRSVNVHTYFITDVQDIEPYMIEQAERIGICGATSTPFWLMEWVKKTVENQLSTR